MGVVALICGCSPLQSEFMGPVSEPDASGSTTAGGGAETSLGSMGGGAETMSSGPGSTMGSAGDAMTMDGGTQTADDSTTGPAPSYPATCQEVLTDDPSAQDGAYTLYIGGDPRQPWTVHCEDMLVGPREYLALPAGPGANFSQYTAGGFVRGTNVRTEFERVRIDPVTLNVEIDDLEFSASTGQLAHGGATVTARPFAVAMCCDDIDSGIARIDLTSTPFVVGVTFCQEGAAEQGGAVEQNGGRIVNITGGGLCGWSAPNNPCPSSNPFSGTGETALQLVYAP